MRQGQGIALPLLSVWIYSNPALSGYQFLNESKKLLLSSASCGNSYYTRMQQVKSTIC
jgi:hypothetical protein